MRFKKNAIEIRYQSEQKMKKAPAESVALQKVYMNCVLMRVLQNHKIVHTFSNYHPQRIMSSKLKVSQVHNKITSF